MQLFQGILLRSSRLVVVLFFWSTGSRHDDRSSCTNRKNLAMLSISLQCSSKEHNLVMGLALPYNRLQITVVRMFMGQQKSINFFLARDYCSCPMALWGYIFSSKTHTQRLEQKHSKNRICASKASNIQLRTTVPFLAHFGSLSTFLDLSIKSVFFVFLWFFSKVSLSVRVSIGELSPSLQNDLALEPSIIDIYGGL